MILGAHVIVYSRNAEADRAFFRDVFGFPSVDAGEGWLIFGVGPAEAAFHPGEDNDEHALYLMTDDLRSLLASLKKRQVACSAVHAQPWGDLASVELPGGGSLGIYQPKHPLALGLGPKKVRRAQPTKARRPAASRPRGSRPPAKRR